MTLFLIHHSTFPTQFLYIDVRGREKHLRCSRKGKTISVSLSPGPDISCCSTPATDLLKTHLNALRDIAGLDFYHQQLVLYAEEMCRAD